MDPRAKQRLTGAVILVALFVLLVPELLTGPKDGVRPPAAEEEGLRRYTIDLAGERAPTAQPAEQPAVNLPALPPSSAGNDGRAQPGEAASADPDPAAESPATVVAQAPTSGSRESPDSTRDAASEVTQPSSRPAPATPAQSASTQPAPSQAVTQPARPAAAGSGRFAVQLGSFGSRENADRLVRDMTAKGFNTFIAPITTSSGRELYRVRVGPAKDRAAAEALAAQLKRMGQSGSVVPIS